jgi:hypothetical protein
MVKNMFVFQVVFFFFLFVFRERLYDVLYIYTLNLNYLAACFDSPIQQPSSGHNIRKKNYTYVSTYVVSVFLRWNHNLYIIKYIWYIMRRKLLDNKSFQLIMYHTYVYIHIYILFSVALRPNAGHGLLILEVSRSHTTTHHSR